MARGRSRHSGEYSLFWPAYVDVLSTLLLVVTLLMSIFMIAQYFAAEEASGKDSALKRLTRQISELTSMLSLEKGKSQSSQDELAALQASLASLKADNEKLTGAGLGADERATAANARQAGSPPTNAPKRPKDVWPRSPPTSKPKKTFRTRHCRKSIS